MVRRYTQIEIAQLFGKVLEAGSTYRIARASRGARPNTSFSVDGITAKAQTSIAAGTDALLIKDGQNWLAYGQAPALTRSSTRARRSKIRPVVGSNTLVAVLFTRETETTIDFWVGGYQASPVFIASIPKTFDSEVKFTGTLSGSGSGSGTGPDTAVSNIVSSAIVSSRVSVLFRIDSSATYTGDADPDPNDSVAVRVSTSSSLSSETAANADSNDPQIDLSGIFVSPAGCNPVNGFFFYGISQSAPALYDSTTSSGSGVITHTILNPVNTIANEYEAWLAIDKSGQITVLIKHKPQFICVSGTKQAFEEILVYSRGELQTYADDVAIPIPSGEWRDSFYNTLRADFQEPDLDPCVDIFRDLTKANLAGGVKYLIELEPNTETQLQQESGKVPIKVLRSAISSDELTCSEAIKTPKTANTFTIGIDVVDIIGYSGVLID